jgi:hypothetical protein
MRPRIVDNETIYVRAGLASCGLPTCVGISSSLAPCLEQRAYDCFSSIDLLPGTRVHEYLLLFDITVLLDK